MLESLYNKVAGLQDGNFNKKRLLAGVFLWNFLIGWSVNYALTMWSYQWRHTLSFHPGPSLTQVLISCLIWHGFLPESCKAVIFWTNSGEDVQRACKFVWGGWISQNCQVLEGTSWYGLKTFSLFSLSAYRLPPSCLQHSLLSGPALPIFIEFTESVGKGYVETHFLMS